MGRSGNEKALTTATEEEGIGARSESFGVVFVDGSTHFANGAGGHFFFLSSSDKENQKKQKNHFQD